MNKAGKISKILNPECSCKVGILGCQAPGIESVIYFLYRYCFVVLSGHETQINGTKYTEQLFRILNNKCLQVAYLSYCNNVIFFKFR